MNHIFQTSVLMMECIELNWLCKHMKKIRSSQPAIPVLNGVKHQFFPGSIVNNQNVRNFYAWPDSTVVLHWLNNKREYKVFVGNPVVKIKKNCYLKWNYVPARNSPADLGNWGCKLKKLCEFWWNGPEWLGDLRTGQNNPILLTIMNLR